MNAPETRAAPGRRTLANAIRALSMDAVQQASSGPLRQGLANAVGMALAEQTLAAQFNRLGHRIIDHRTYAFVGVRGSHSCRLCAAVS